MGQFRFGRFCQIKLQLQQISDGNFLTLVIGLSFVSNLVVKIASSLNREH